MTYFCECEENGYRSRASPRAITLLSHLAIIFFKDFLLLTLNILLIMKKKNLIMLMMCLMAMCWSPMTAQETNIRGDVNYDSLVDIDDITTLISYVLTGQWPESSAPETQSFTVNGVTFKMVGVEGGTFMMGALENDPGAPSYERPAHEVTLSSYYIGETAVTQLLWYAVMYGNPSNATGNLTRPVELVSWNDCQTFITKLNQMTGKQFRLLTEAEWEFAARGGNMSNGYLFAGSNTLDDVAWYTDNSGNQSQPVATKLPNELGLYDMSGGVWELCHDFYASDYYSYSPSLNPTGPESGTNHVARGGSFSTDDRGCRVTQRLSVATNNKFNNLGFRLAM